VGVDATQQLLTAVGMGQLMVFGSCVAMQEEEEGDHFSYHSTVVGLLGKGCWTTG